MAHIVFVSLTLVSDDKLCCYKCQCHLANLPYLPTVKLLCDKTNCKGIITIKVNIYRP